jgi:hypothetical protein
MYIYIYLYNNNNNKNKHLPLTPKPLSVLLVNKAFLEPLEPSTFLLSVLPCWSRLKSYLQGEFISQVIVY